MRGFFSALYVSADDDEAKKSVAWFVTTFTIVLIFILVAALCIALSNLGFWSAPNFMTFLGVSLLTGATGFAGGALIGFLFGVPRVKTLAASSDDAPDVTSNTNLEQVSDWLTKIIVGVSLVEFQRINGALLDFGRMVDASLTGPVQVRPGTFIVSHIGGAGFSECLVLVASAISGFIAAYLKSKTDLMRAFGQRKEVESRLGNVIAEQIMGAAGRQVLDRPTIEPDKCARDMAAKFIQLVCADSQDADLYRLLGLAQAILKNFQAAADAFGQAVKLTRSPSASLVALATRAMALAGDAAGAETMQSANASSAGGNTVEANESKLAAMFAQLYARGGYDEAIRIGKELAADPSMGRSGRLWLYLASAWGQRHAALSIADPRDQGAIDEARDAALQAVRTALQLDPAGNRPILRSLWDQADPNRFPGENDLESFYGDDAFAKLLMS